MCGQLQAERGCSTERSCVFYDPFLTNQVSSIAQSQTHVTRTENYRLQSHNIAQNALKAMCGGPSL